MKNVRPKVILGIFLTLAAIIICRLIYLQIVNGKFYQSQALGQQVGFAEVKGDRGEVFSENSQESKGAFESGQRVSLAINEDKWLLYVRGKEVEDKNHFAEVLGNAIEEPVENILAKLENADSYTVIKKDILLKDVEVVKQLGLKGLYLEKTPGRYYPQHEFASQVIGFLGGDGIGQYGIEGYHEETVKGKEGIKEEKRGLDAIDSQDTSYLNGSDLLLTIDYNIQFQAELLLSQAARDIGIDSGQIIVIKPDSGRVLTLANFPNFNPNKYFKEQDLDIFQNSAVQKVFEPGSVFKPFTMAMALHERKVTPSTVFYDSGSVKIGPDTVYNFNHESYGQRNMSEILEKSINTGAVFLSQLIPHRTFLEYVERLGLGEKTGIDLQGEVYSRNENLKQGSDFEFATASFGQGIEMTPIQLVRAFSIFANGGKIVTPYVVDKVIKGQEEITTKPKLSDPIISEKTALEVTTMLINVVEEGFGNIAKIKGYYLAGKTGTAEVSLRNGKGYYKDQTVQSFIGFGPALKPQFLILVKLDNPKVSRSALSAAPIFKKLVQYIINYWQIPPDY